MKSKKYNEKEKKHFAETNFKSIKTKKNKSNYVTFRTLCFWLKNSKTEKEVK
jgi:hypothetical protein